MPVPAGLSPPLQAYLEELETRLSGLEAPQGFTPAFLTLSSNLTAANAAAHAARIGLATDLKMVVWSDGVRWWRADTGAQIV
jgi:hypothetical protein